MDAHFWFETTLLPPQVSSTVIHGRAGRKCIKDGGLRPVLESIMPGMWKLFGLHTHAIHAQECARAESESDTHRVKKKHTVPCLCLLLKWKRNALLVAHGFLVAPYFSNSYDHQQHKHNKTKQEWKSKSSLQERTVITLRAKAQKRKFEAETQVTRKKKVFSTCARTRQWGPCPSREAEGENFEPLRDEPGANHFPTF